MRLKVKSYEIKNVRTKSKNPKVNNVKLNVKGLGGIKDNRKYVNDTTLSEAEKLSRRMALENMKRKSGNVRSHNKNKLFSKDFGDDDTWHEDPFLLKAKQIGELDEGLDESSEEEPVEDDTEKYFSQGANGKNKRKTLEEIIHDSKVEKCERYKANEEDIKIVTELNKDFREVFSKVLPKIGKAVKAQSTKDFKADEHKYGDMFQKNFETLIYAQRPQKADNKSLKVNVPEKEKDKMVNLKIKRLREHLVKEGIAKDYDEDDSDIDENGNDDDSDSNEIDEDDEEQDGSENDDSVEENDEDDDDEGDEETDDHSDVDLDDEDSNGSDNSEDLPDAEANSDEAIKNLKKLIGQSNKVTKRKLDDATDDDNLSKKPKLDNSKNEVDCFRVLLKMKDLRKEALLVMASEISSGDVSEKNVARQLMLATLFQNCLKTDKPHSYSPELLGFIKRVMENASTESSSWLSVKSNSTHLNKDCLLNVCNDNFDDVNKLALSTVFHVSNLLLSVLDCNTLTNQQSLFVPFLDIINKCPTQFYPSWLREKIDEIVKTIEPMKSQDVPVLSLKKVFKIVQLLEPDLNSKFDPAKDITKNLKEKVKKEKRETKRALKMKANIKQMNELAEEKKQSILRKKKTMEIINGLSNK